ncbi:MAG: transporter [Sandaracinaceae bacterium]|nr:transporter [Sandaracinaceae bacterium]
MPHFTPLIALFFVASVGFLVGRVEVRGVALGVAAVLFAGLAVSAVVPDVSLPEIVPQLGLALFIYAIGVASGPGFFAMFRARGVRDVGLTLGVLTLGAAMTTGLGRLLGLSSATTTGLFCGALTNTPALAAAVQSLERAGGASTEPVVAYSVAYPLGVLGLLAAMLVAERLFRDDSRSERTSSVGASLIGQHLETTTVRVGAAGAGRSPGQLREEHTLRVAFGRLRRGEVLRVCDEREVLREGDLLSLVGTASELRRAEGLLGAGSSEHLELDREVLDFRRIFVSRKDVVERPLRELHLLERFGATVTRVRRGDVELLPDDDTELELGDRVRVIAPRARMAELTRLFGDSYTALGELDVLTFGLGIVLGLALGEVPIPLPLGLSFRLGVAGGPLVVGLILGRIGRTGPLVWSLPYAASVTLRQLGLVLFLAGVGLRSGHAFVETLSGGGGLGLLLAGGGVTFVSALVVLGVAHRVLRMPFAVVLGVVSGIHTQPAALAFATDRSRNDLPRLGYASVFPIATVAKIVIAQLLLSI